MKPISSAITTPPAPQPSQTGTPRGERGSAIVESSRVAAWLAGKRPEEVDSAAVSRASSLGARLRVITTVKAIYDDRGNLAQYETVARGCEVEGTAEACSEAAAHLERLMEPAPVEAIEAWLAELSVIVARRPDDSFGDEMRTTAYAARLRQYPADVAREAVLRMPWKFWPAWAELEAACKRKVSSRRCMIAALKRGPEPADPPRRPPTAEERARIMELVRKKFPEQTEEMRKAAVDEALKGNCIRVDT
jgi:hypothetical protein